MCDKKYFPKFIKSLLGFFFKASDFPICHLPTADGEWEGKFNYCYFYFKPLYGKMSNTLTHTLKESGKTKIVKSGGRIFV
jgi:hypothetical protein